MRIRLLLVACCFLSLATHAQPLQPGFDRDEYLQMLYISARTSANHEYYSKIEKPTGYKMIYQSPAMGLDNLWQLWYNENRKLAVISIRGTTHKAESWLLNFYAAMIPAKGEISWGDNQKFDYQLSADPKAAVHVGWMVGTAFLAKDILPRIDSLYKTGTTDFIVLGHSQGGAIAYLLTAYLDNLIDSGKLPADIKLKTYCSASPKPGNLFFAYSYEDRTRGGWAYNVVNSLDWVPEVPVSIQTLNDFSEVNPFKHADLLIKKQKFPKRLVLKHVFNKLNKPTRKAQRNYQRYLGEKAYNLVLKDVPNLKVPPYVQSSDYVRTGTTIVLKPDSGYFKKFPQDSSHIFVNHVHPPYIYLARELPGKKNKSMGLQAIQGTWQLDSIPGIISMDSLFAKKIPYVEFRPDQRSISGNTGCNAFNGMCTYQGQRLSIAKNLAMTKMFCPGQGESRFISALKSAMSWNISPDGTHMVLLNGNRAVMWFHRE